MKKIKAIGDFLYSGHLSPSYIDNYGKIKINKKDTWEELQEVQWRSLKDKKWDDLKQQTA